MRLGIVLSNPPAYSETFFNSKIKGLLDNDVDVTLFTQVADSEFNLCKVVLASKVSGNSVLQVFKMVVVFVSLLPKLTTVKRFVVLERKENTSWFNLLKKIYLNAHMLKSKVDCLHFGFATQAIGSELVAQSIGAKMAVSFRGFDINVYPIKYPKCYNLLWKHVDAVHSISQYLLDKAHGLGLSKTTPSKLITPAVNCKKIGSVSVGQQNISKLQILTIARLHWIKGIDLLIESAALLKENGLSFTWSIIGSGDQKSLERYKFHIYERGLQEEVLLLDKLTHEQTLTHLQQTDIYVQPSFNEGFCNAVLEAQALGKLCIATDVGGLSESIINFKTGWLVPSNDSKALALKINEVMELSEIDKTNIETVAASRVKLEFTIEQQQEQFVKFYNDICKK
jgi:colanic acid/amylovoran biosynthesis glycosyltransferase